MNVSERLASLRRLWKEALSSDPDIIEVIPEFEYRTPEQKARWDKIFPALQLWKFVFHVMSNDSAVVRREFLSQFLGDENHFISLVATIECLPTSVWRRILWKHNIDFMSMESFLRRITAEQVFSLCENYYDLFVEGEMPRVFDRRYLRKHKPTVWDLKQERPDPEARYAKKGSWSYNLLNLDFGFNAYFKGEANDARMVAQTPLEAFHMFVTKFISGKNHADDFVVCQEEGKYWAMYKSARSNFVWFPNRNVELKSHICPGFWYTLLMHAWFRIISPVFFITAAGMFSGLEKGSSMARVVATLIVMIPGLLTPLWCIAALGKLVVMRSDSAHEALGEKIRWLNAKCKQHSRLLMIVSLTVAALGFASVLYKTFVFLSSFVGAFTALVWMVGALIYCGYKLYYRATHEYWPDVSDFPLYLRLPLIFAVLHVLLALGIALKTEILKVINVVASFVGEFLAELWWIIASSWIFILVLAVPAAISLGFMYALLAVSEKTLTRVSIYFEKACKYLSAALVLVSVGVIGFSGHVSAVTGVSMGAYVPIAAIVLVYMGALWYLTIAMNPDTKMMVRQIKYVRMPARLLFGLRANTWFTAAEESTRLEQLDRAYDFARKVRGVDSDSALWVILPALSIDLLNKLELVIYDFGYVDSTRTQLAILEELCKNHELSFAEARERAFAKRQKRERRWGLVKKTLFPIFLPPRLLLKGINIVGGGFVFVGRKCLEYLQTLYALYELFNKKCPTITKTGKVK